MGADPSAKVFYGICIPKPDEDAGQSWDQWNETWEEENGPPRPHDDGDYRSSSWDAWRQKHQEYEGSLAFVEVAFAGAEGVDEEGHYIHCPALSIETEWDKIVDLQGVGGRHPAADDQIKRFCDRFGLPYSKPGWRLAAKYF